MTGDSKATENGVLDNPDSSPDAEVMAGSARRFPIRPRHLRPVRQQTLLEGNSCKPSTVRGYVVRNACMLFFVSEFLVTLSPDS